MARLLGIIVFIGIVAAIFSAMFGGGAARRGTYRPRQRWDDFFGGRRQGEGDPGLTHLAKRGELIGLRDAFSSAPLDPAQPLYRCSGCQSFYHHGSVEVLARENRHRCTVCGGTDIGPVRVVD
jgi:hypothetical protein